MKQFSRRARIVFAIAIIGVIAAIVTYIISVALAQRAADRPFFTAAQTSSQTTAPRRPLVMAHQGGDGLWPGNTMYAFEHAAALGVDVLEMDIHSTSDGELIVMHDDTVDRTTDGRGAINTMSVRQIKALDAGYRWSPDDGRTFPFRAQGITAPLLEEVLTAFPDKRLNIEIKTTETPHVIGAFCEMIRTHGMTNRVLVASFHKDNLTEFRRLCPEVATSASTSEVVKFLALEKTFLGAAYTPPAQALQVPERFGALDVLTPRFIATAHERNMQVHAWTINREGDMRTLRDMGVDGIITDYPDRLLAILNQ